MGLFQYTVRRILFLIMVLIGVTIAAFIISNTVPGDPLVANLGQTAMSDPEIVERYERRWGLDRSLPEQYLIYMSNLLQGDMGTSIRSQRPVIDDLKQYFPATFELATLATLLSIIFGLIFGIISAVKRNKLIDHFVRAISVTGISMPAFWLALMSLYLFYFLLDIAPGSGRLSADFSGFSLQTGFLIIDSISAGRFDILKNALYHMILPALVLAGATMGIITRTVRSSLLDVMSQDYLRTARAKGLNETVVIMKHALLNALIPTLTIFGLSYGNLLGGTVLVESIFDYPGLGWYAYISATTLDFPAIMGATILIALVYSVMNLLVDVTYGIIDPRVRY